MNTLEICVSGVIPCFYQRLISCLHQRADTAAKLLIGALGILGSDI